MCKAVKPACPGDNQQMERFYDVAHCPNRLSVILPDNNIIRLVRIFALYGEGRYRYDRLDTFPAG